jgi:UDP-N-acetylmuramate: L-alanyl-gamma-D-glutamyl-meso-diaminopimelate ligase
MHYHLIGIAGTAMASLAGLLRARGHHVTGSDHGVYPPMSTMLDEMGIEYARRYAPENLDPPPDVVVVGNAISRGNEELEAALDGRLRYTSAAAVLKEEFLWGRHVVAIAGTHGKTTTTSLVAWILECGGLEPAFLIGGVSENFGLSYRLTESEYFVIEADEYDTAYFDKGPKMWHYLPQTAVVTNVEFDHADIYRDAEAYRFAFQRFINLIPRTGTLVAGWDSPVLRELSSGSFAPVESFGTTTEEEAGREGKGSAEASAHPRWKPGSIAYGPDGTRFEVLHDEVRVGVIETPLSGPLNVRNALAAIAAAHAIGVEWRAIRRPSGRSGACSDACRFAARSRA